MHPSKYRPRYDHPPATASEWLARFIVRNHRIEFAGGRRVGSGYVIDVSFRPNILARLILCGLEIVGRIRRAGR